MRLKFKAIRKQGRLFLFRASLQLADGGSVKAHLILNDDLDGAHKHPWNFTSFMLLGAYTEEVDGRIEAHRPFSLVRRYFYERHRVILYRVGPCRLPCITVGRYSAKMEPWCERQTICDFCRPMGECADKAYWRERHRVSGVDTEEETGGHGAA